MNKCPLCGKDNPAAEWACEDCGAQLPNHGNRQHTAAPPSALTTPAKTLDAQSITIGGLAILALIAFLFFMARYGTNIHEQPLDSPSIASTTAYTIVSRTEGPLQVTYRVRVPSGAPRSDMESWSTQIKARESKNVLINFYDGDPGVNTMVASYQIDRLYMTRQ